MGQHEVKFRLFGHSGLGYQFDHLTFLDDFLEFFIDVIDHIVSHVEETWDLGQIDVWQEKFDCILVVLGDDEVNPGWVFVVQRMVHYF
jgi:hypothetical protein